MKAFGWTRADNSSLALVLAICLLFLGGAPVPAQEAAKTAYPYDITIDVDRPDLAARMRSRSRLVAERGQAVPSLGRLRGRVNADLATFRDILRAEGFYDGRLQTLTERQGNTVDIRIIVAPGPQYVFGDIALKAVDGSLAGTLADTLLNQTGLTVGAAARTKSVLDGETSLMRALPEAGFPFARRQNREIVVDHRNRTVDVAYAVATGPRVVVDDLRFAGAEGVDRRFLDRVAEWQDNTLYDQAAVDSMRRRLIATGLFRSLRTRLARQDSLIEAPHEESLESSDLVVDLVPADMHTISIGAGYSTTEGVGVEGGWEHRNFFGSGERLRATATVAQIEQGLRLDFLKPYFRRPDQSLTGEAAFRRDDTDAFDDVTAEASVGLDRRLSAHWAVGAAVTTQFSRIQEDGVRRNFLLAGLPLVANWNTTEDILDPKGGGRLRVNFEPFTAWQSGNFFFTRTEIEGSTYWGIDKDDDIILAVRAALGSINGAGRDRLPANKRFYAGGGGSIRGFGFQDVGPRDGDGDPIGGRSLAEVSIEARLRLSENIGLVPFIEGGNVYEEKLPQFSGLRWGGGLGFRYYTTFAPIRVDLATPINRRPGDNRIQFYISIGQSF